jgi:hypothetical protein
VIIEELPHPVEHTIVERALCLGDAKGAPNLGTKGASDGLDGHAGVNTRARLGIPRVFPSGWDLRRDDLRETADGIDEFLREAEAVANLVPISPVPQ